MNRFHFVFVILLGTIVFTGCNKSDSDKNGGVDEDWAGWGSGSAPSTLRQDYNTGDMDNFFEINLKMENMKLQFAKLMSNGWEGDLLGGVGAKSDPTEMYKLLEEILDKKDVYLKAVRTIDNQGILDDVTTGVTRGIFTSTYEMIVNGWGETAKNRRMKILTMLEQNKVMGNSKAQQELFNSLPAGLKKGETDAKKWFNNLNQGKYDNACPQIHARWVNMGAGQSGDVSSALGQYYVAAETAAGGKNPLHIDAYKVGVKQVEKGMNVCVALWDEASGGYVGKWQDADAIASETSRLRQKILDGSATPADIRRWVSGVGSIYAKEKLGELLPDVGDVEYDSEVAQLISDLTDTAKGEIIDNVTEWLTENGVQGAENSAEGNNVSILDIRNSIDNAGGAPTAVIFKDSNGRLTIGFADKNGNIKATGRPGEKNLTTTTRDGKRATRKTNTKAGNNELKAIPDIDSAYEWYVEVSPQQLVFDYQTDKDVLVVTTYAKYFSAKSKSDWIHVSLNGTNVIVEVDQNDTGDTRYGSVLIGLSQDKETFPKTATITVYQRAEPEAQDLASFIDFNDLRIEEIVWNADHEAGTGDLTTVNINPGRIIYNVPYPFDDLKVTSFAARDLTTRRISDNVYEVSGSKVEPISQGSWTDEDGLLSPDSPYGLYYDFSFNIEAREPTDLVTENNFAVTNFKANGYYKWRDELTHADLLYKFSLEASVAGINDETYTKRACELDAFYTHLLNETTLWRWDVSFKYFDSNRRYDANENVYYEHTPRSSSNKGSTTDYIRSDFKIKLAW